jgi:hypothetical protein
MNEYKRVSKNMNILEANIKLTRKNHKLVSVSVNMPIWNKHSEYGKLEVILPMLGIKTIAKDENDAEKAIEEAIISFCIVAERFGQGIEKELESLNWIAVDDASGEPILGYNVTDPDSVIERILQTGENYVNPHLAIA